MMSFFVMLMGYKSQCQQVLLNIIVLGWMNTLSDYSKLFQGLKVQNKQILQKRLLATQRQLLKEQVAQLDKFIQRHQQKEAKPIMLLTSGGTSVSLEKNTVRMLQNFSTGTRGSLLAEQILAEGFPLVFFYRDNSFLPFLSGLTVHDAVLDQDETKLQKIVQGRKSLQKYHEKLLLLPFKTIYYYLTALLFFKQQLPQKSVLILCAAVSDFIPEQVSEHKIHTKQNLQLKFCNSPKILGNLVDERHLTVSFKLETDPSKIQQRIQFAIDKYKVDMVVGNLLNNKNWVKIIINNKQQNPQVKNSYQYKEQIQKNIIKTVCEYHSIKFNIN